MGEGRGPCAGGGADARSSCTWRDSCHREKGIVREGERGTPAQAARMEADVDEGAVAHNVDLAHLSLTQGTLGQLLGTVVALRRFKDGDGRIMAGNDGQAAIECLMGQGQREEEEEVVV